VLGDRNRGWFRRYNRIIDNTTIVVSCSASDRVAPVQIVVAVVVVIAAVIVVVVVSPVVQPGKGFHRRKDRFEFLEPDPLLLLFLLLGNVVQFDGSVPAAAESSAAVVPAGSSAAPAAVEAATAVETPAAAQSPAFAETAGQAPKTETSPIEGIEPGTTAVAVAFGGSFGGRVEIGTALAVGRVVSSRPGVGPQTCFVGRAGGGGAWFVVVVAWSLGGIAAVLRGEFFGSFFFHFTQEVVQVHGGVLAGLFGKRGAFAGTIELVQIRVFVAVAVVVIESIDIGRAGQIGQRSGFFEHDPFGLCVVVANVVIVAIAIAIAVAIVVLVAVAVVIIAVIQKVQRNRFVAVEIFGCHGGYLRYGFYRTAADILQGWLFVIRIIYSVVTVSCSNTTK